MSLFSRIFYGRSASAAAVLGAAEFAGGRGVELPWSSAASSAALSLVRSDIYGSSVLADAVTRETAMTVAPIKRGRGVIVSKLADLPLELGVVDARRKFTPDPEQPAWLTGTRNPQSPWHRIALTLDDLVFHGWSVWVIERDEAGAILDAGRIAFERWEFDDTTPTGLRIDSRPVDDPDTVLLIAGPDEGLLVTARETIRGWRYMDRAWVGRVRNPIPAMVIQETHENGATEAEAEAAVEAWAAARTSENGAVGWLPYGLELKVHGEADADLFDKGRNACRIDVANHLNLPLEAVGGSSATASLTYSTREDSRVQLVDDLEYWLAPVEAALHKLAGAGKTIRADREFLTLDDPPGDELPDDKESAA